SPIEMERLGRISPVPPSTRDFQASRTTSSFVFPQPDQYGYYPSTTTTYASYPSDALARQAVHNIVEGSERIAHHAAHKVAVGAEKAAVKVVQKAEDILQYSDMFMFCALDALLFFILSKTSTQFGFISHFAMIAAL